MKQQRKIPTTTVILVICALITVVISFWPSGLNDSERAIFFGAYYKAFCAAGEWWRFLTVGFVHVSVIHLFMNMTSLYMLGRALEPTLKPGKFLVLLFGSVIGGSVFYYCTGRNTVAVGLSGGLYGLLAAYVYLVWQGGALRIPQVRNAVLQTIAINLVINFMPSVGWRAHFGGAITGLLLIMILDERENIRDMKRNALLALAALCVVSVFAVRKSSDLSNDDIYLLTDAHILEKECDLGFENYARHMAQNLDRVYDSDYLEQLFR